MFYSYNSFLYVLLCRPSVSPPKLSTRPSSHVWTPAYNDLDKPETNPSELPVPKRTRLPFASDRGNDSVHDDTERYEAINQRWSGSIWDGLVDRNTLYLQIVVNS